MRFPLDLVYLDRARVVIKVREHFRPWRISLCLRADSLLELAEGAVTRAQIRPGDCLDFSPAVRTAS